MKTFLVMDATRPLTVLATCDRAHQAVKRARELFKETGIHHAVFSLAKVYDTEDQEDLGE